FILPVFCTAQSVGHLGKRAIVKTNVVNGIRLGFNSAEAEYTLSRRVSINGSFEWFNYSRGSKGVKVRTGRIKPRNEQFSSYTEHSTLKNGTTQGWTAGLGAKIYFDYLTPAPYGFYSALYIAYGNASFKNYEVSYHYKESWLNTNVSLSSPPERKPETNLNSEAAFFSVDFPSLGYQRIYKGLIALDFKLSLFTQYCKLPDNLANAFEHNYYFRSNTVTYARGNFSFGPNVYLKLGFLLF
ncbi:MAG: hypothetical protein KF900_06420, partial [Bacteroidetes bacterium]|nr:hypothetical protein [Bacteroidota bacterium]